MNRQPRPQAARCVPGSGCALLGVWRTIPAAVLLALGPLGALAVSVPPSAAPIDLPFPLEHQLEKTSRNLGLKPATVRLARQLLRESADGLAGDERAVATSGRLATQWRRFDPANARAALLKVFDVLRGASSSSRVCHEYVRRAHGASILLGHVAFLDTTSARERIDSWPAPPAGICSDIPWSYTYFPNRVWEVYYDLLLDEEGREATLQKLDQDLLGHLAPSFLIRIGSRYFGEGRGHAGKGDAKANLNLDKGLDLIRRAYWIFDSQIADLYLLDRFLNALRVVSHLDGALLTEGILVFDSALQRVAFPSGHRTVRLLLKSGGEMALSALQARRLRALAYLKDPAPLPGFVSGRLHLRTAWGQLERIQRRADGQPVEAGAALSGEDLARYREPARLFLDSIPFKSRRGGLNLESRNVSLGASEFSVAERVVPFTHPDTWRGVRMGPWKVHARTLDREFSSPDQFDNLLYIASDERLRAGLRRHAVSLAYKALAATPELERQARMMGRILRASSKIRPGGNERYLEAGLRILAALEKERRQASATRKEMLERRQAVLRNTVIAAWATHDLEGALLYARTVDGRHRFAGLLRILEAL